SAGFIRVGCRHPMSPLRQLVLAAAALAAMAPSAFAIDLHAHRGGGLDNGTPVAFENSLSAFKAAPGRGADVVELDVHVSNAGVRLNVEINHYPTEPSYDPGPGFVNAELDTIDASGIPKSQILLQSFLPANLDPARQRGYRTALITFSGANDQALSLAQKGGYEVLEPEWPVENARAFVKNAHAAGREVIPWTI